MNLLKYNKFYLIGIKGVGMTMLAQFLKSLGKDVSGSDVAEVFMTDRVLVENRIKVFNGFNAKQVPQDAIIIYSSAYNPVNNQEMLAVGLLKKVRVLSYAQAIGAVFNHYQGIAVCGSHGKTTVSAWLGFVLGNAGLDPSVLVGAAVPQLGGCAILGSSKYFIAEADEYQNKLQYFKPQGIVLNNIDYDHPDFFKTKASYNQVFADFVSRLPKSGFLVANANDAEVLEIIKQSHARVYSYAVSESMANVNIKDLNICLLAHSLRQTKDYQYFQVNDLGEFKIQLFGVHNVANALAVLASGLALGYDPLSLKKALSQFKGIARRAQLLGSFKGAKIFDDYGHHPSEVKATITAFKERFKKQRLIVIFHPHTFTRTKALFSDFAISFDLADYLGVLPIYGSAREKQGGVSSQDLVSEIEKRNEAKVVYLKSFEVALKFLKKELKKDDVVLLLGAGDVFRIGERLLQQ